MPSERKVVSDTEVFHDRCLSLIPRSLTNLLKVKAIQLDARVKTLEPEARDAARLRIEIDNANSEARRMRAERDRMTSEARDARTELAGERQARHHYQQLVEQLRVDQADKQRQIDSLARELALQHQLASPEPVQPPPPPQPPRAVPPAKPQQESDTRSDGEIMFSLLELD